MPASAPTGKPLSIRFEIPRSELERLEAAPRAVGLDETHLRGKVIFDIGVPLAPDPVLEFLKAKRGLVAGPPLTVDLQQPVGYLLGQLASAAVLALHGEGDFSIPLTGGRGAVSVAAKDGALELGLPLKQYAGIAAVPAADAASAIAAAIGALHRVLASRAGLSGWSFLPYLVRERAILEGDAKGPGVVSKPPIFSGLSFRWNIDTWAAADGGDLPTKAAEIESRGGHVVPYWRVSRTDQEGGVQFSPVRTPGQAARRGAIALCIFPGVERLLELDIHGDSAGTKRLIERLKRPVPFSARILRGGLVGLADADRTLPVV